MAERTSYTAGTFCWTDLSTPDQAGAKAFYSALFGWEAFDAPIGDGASGAVRAAHRSRAHLHRAIGAERRTKSGVEQLAVLECYDACDRCLEGGRALLEQLARVHQHVQQDPPNLGAVVAQIGAERTRACVDQNGGSGRH